MKPKEHTWGQYIRNGVGLKLSRLGELVGFDTLIYNPVILELFDSIAMENAPKVVAALREMYPTISTVADVGCGGGAFAAEFNRVGARSIGLERSPHGIQMARRRGVDCQPFDVALPIRKQINETVELAYSFEVAEHVPVHLADNFVHFIAALAPLVVFSAAQPKQGGIGHINEQPLSYWIERFEGAGFELSLSETEAVRENFRQRNTSDWFHNNTCVFRRLA